MDKRNNDLTSEASVLQKEISKLDAELTAASNQLTLDEAKAQLTAINAEVAEGERIKCQNGY